MYYDHSFHIFSVLSDVIDPTGEIYRSSPVSLREGSSNSSRMNRRLESLKASTESPKSEVSVLRNVLVAQSNRKYIS